MQKVKKKLSAAEREAKAVEWIGTQVMFELMKENEEITVDNFYDKMRGRQVESRAIGRCTPGLIRSLKAAGYLKSSGSYTISDRNDSSLIAIYLVNKTKKPSVT